MHFTGFDRLLGSHYDEYVITYTKFTATVDSSAFDVDTDKCISFPGPGNTLAMAENPMFEYVGAEGYGSEHQSHKVERDFAEFRDKHSREYQDDKEEAFRKFHFQQNHRYVCVYTSSSSA